MRVLLSSRNLYGKKLILVAALLKATIQSFRLGASKPHLVN
jgi:hypothetical protein